MHLTYPICKAFHFPDENLVALRRNVTCVFYPATFNHRSATPVSRPRCSLQYPGSLSGVSHGGFKGRKTAWFLFYRWKTRDVKTLIAYINCHPRLSLSVSKPCSLFKMLKLTLPWNLLWSPHWKSVSVSPLPAPTLPLSLSFQGWLPSMWFQPLLAMQTLPQGCQRLWQQKLDVTDCNQT